MRLIGIDEHRWAHTRHAAGQGYVTVIGDLTPVIEGWGRLCAHSRRRPPA